MYRYNEVKFTKSIFFSWKLVDVLVDVSDIWRKKKCQTCQMKPRDSLHVVLLYSGQISEYKTDPF